MVAGTFAIGGTPGCGRTLISRAKLADVGYPIGDRLLVTVASRVTP